MAKFASRRAREFYAETYDAVVADWPGEIDFYRRLAAEAQARDQGVLDVACGTGRVAVRLAQDGLRVVGLDRSETMLAVARDKSRGLGGLRWVKADMRCFDLGERFGLAFIAGHSFQNILTLEDQVATLEAIRRHLVPDGVLAVHLDYLRVQWLGELTGSRGGMFEEAESFRHPRTDQLIRTRRAWSYEPASQTASSQTVWQSIDEEGAVTDRWESGPLRFHCVFPFEMAHLLARTGFVVQSLWGDFLGHELQDDSSEMVWVACRG